MVLHPSGPIAQRRFFHRRLPTTGAYGCLHQRLERKGRALRLDQEKGPPTPLQRQAYHSALIPGTSRNGPVSVRSVVASSVCAPAAGFHVEQKRVTRHWSPLRLSICL